jgi:uncharacterized membrane protein
MPAFLALFALATLLCSLVAGFLFAFAVVVMPGLKSLDDRQFVRAFQVVDRVIQNNQPLFLLTWVGSALALVAAAALGYGQLEGPWRFALLGVTLVYLLGVQVPTVAVNVPLNNHLQAVATESASAAELRSARAAFEPRWNRWNTARTLVAIATALALIALACRL